MRIIILVLSMVILSGCAGEKDAAAENVCVDEVFPFQHTYQNGQTLKSFKVVCSNGCTTIAFVNDPTVNEVSCQ